MVEYQYGCVDAFVFQYGEFTREFIASFKFGMRPGSPLRQLELDGSVAIDSKKILAAGFKNRIEFLPAVAVRCGVDFRIRHEGFCAGLLITHSKDGKVHID